MASILGFRIQNYRCLRDVSFGLTSQSPKNPVLTGLTVVIGKNGTGKSTLLDAFGFLSDCLIHGVEDACNKGQRGGFDRLRSKGCQGPIALEINYREAKGQPPFSYSVEINADPHGLPQVETEILVQRRPGRKPGKPLQFLSIRHGRGEARFGADDGSTADEPSRVVPINLHNQSQLGIMALGALNGYPHIEKLRIFLAGWYLSYFEPNAARGLPLAGPQQRLNSDGSNLGNVAQFMQREDPARFTATLKRIAERIPGIRSIDTLITFDKRLLLRFNESGFQDPFYAQQMSDGTLKLFAYLLLLESRDPPSLMCIEEPENGLYHKLLEILVREFRAHTQQSQPSSQIFVATHHPYFLDALSPQEVWIMDKGPDGFSTARRASDIELVRNMVDEGIPLGSLWYSNYFDPR